MPCFIEESWPLGTCRAVFLTLPFCPCWTLSVCSYQADQCTVHVLFLKARVGQLFTLMLSYLLFILHYTSLIAAPLLTCCQECSFLFLWSEVYQWALAADQTRVLMQVRKLHCLLNPLAGVTGTAAEC